MRSRIIWIVVILAALGAAGYFYRDTLLGLINGEAATTEATAEEQLVERALPIRPAADIAQVSAAGNIELASEQSVVFQVEGIIADITVEVGDQVEVGDPLVILETDDLTRAVAQAELNVTVNEIKLEALKTSTDASEADIIAAEADLASAQADLALLQEGASSAELAAAQTSLAAARLKYEELQEGPTEAEIVQLSAELNRAFIALEQAQQAYDQIAYSDSIGASQQSQDLQEATLDFDVAKAAYEESIAPVADSELQDALSTINSAQAQLEELTVTEAEIIAAEAKIKNAEASLANLFEGVDETDLVEAELNLAQAELDLEEAQADLEKAQITAPIEGAILGLELNIGERVTAGQSALTISDLNQLELTVNVAEVDVSKVEIGQRAQIALDALPDRDIEGRVTRIAPTSVSDSGVVNYGVTIQLDSFDLAGVRPGMTAVASLQDDSTAQQWLVPTTGIREFEGETMVVAVRNGERTRIQVERGTSQGEWTVVESDDLQAGDQVIGRVNSFIDSEDETQQRGPGLGRGLGGGGGGGRR